jgi:hypothetical protein
MYTSKLHHHTASLANSASRFVYVFLPLLHIAQFLTACCLLKMDSPELDLTCVLEGVTIDHPPTVSKYLQVMEPTEPIRTKYTSASLVLNPDISISPYV